uniref:Phosphodiesterase n=1 Tax=Tetraselmis sp. GSL018 TaxID=582737 RepID=A0A061S0Z1_9CHLO|mmetsp:Transcript_33122/g.78553  ORF Transcript_33122/g.78553 Transcript_33122/m.78553 type:complete len:431 (+) Transcript_33122:362-1654(+)|eukprot:CAMPEP_0177610226 /NCGR_PEP_ID=MMETSP0419_2-20121207/19640_1 /TAXON_ID=582737 /ORGANISM="Tetraselmis sp., Strain GSL018" /LENGTH=430 /DNA_ID=CAMNT_0019105465 /DNA_START=300 /DNA_END=1592 /DNA_ORIENTATION=-
MRGLGCGKTSECHVDEPSPKRQLQPSLKSAPEPVAEFVSNAKPKPGVRRSASAGAGSPVVNPVLSGSSAACRLDSAPQVFDAFRWTKNSDKPLVQFLTEALGSLCDELCLDRDKLIQFVMFVESSMPGNRYHNAVHILDALQLMHLFMFPGGPLEGPCQDNVVKLAAYLGTLCHDLKHPGLTNQFLHKSKNALISKYGDRSTLESMHLRYAKRALRDPQMDFMAALDAATRDRVVHLMEKMIMATDMAAHEDFVKAAPPQDEEELLVFKLQIAVKCADLSHCIRKFRVHQKFVEGLKCEFESQGQLERKQGIHHSAAYEEALGSSTGLAVSQSLFLEEVLTPLLKALARCAGESPVVEELLQALERNCASWKKLCSVSSDGSRVTYTDSRVKVHKLALETASSSVLSEEESRVVSDAMRHMHDMVQYVET